MGCSVHRTLLPFPLSLKPPGTCHPASTGSPPLPAALSPGSHTGSSEPPWPPGPTQDSNAARPHHPPGGPPLPHLPVQARHLPGHSAQSLGRRHRRCWNPPGGSDVSPLPHLTCSSLKALLLTSSCLRQDPASSLTDLQATPTPDPWFPFLQEHPCTRGQAGPPSPCLPPRLPRAPADRWPDRQAPHPSRALPGPWTQSDLYSAWAAVSSALSAGPRAGVQ